MSRIVQCELIEDTIAVEKKVMVTWLEADRGVKAGDIVTLKDFLPELRWQVITVGLPHERSDIKRGWGMTDYMGKEKDRT